MHFRTFSNGLLLNNSEKNSCLWCDVDLPKSSRNCACPQHAQIRRRSHGHHIHACHTMTGVLRGNESMGDSIHRTSDRALILYLEQMLGHTYRQPLLLRIVAVWYLFSDDCISLSPLQPCKQCQCAKGLEKLNRRL